jgi:hypothetical protein
MKYAHIYHHRHLWPVRLQCEVLKVSFTGYHQHQLRRQRMASRRHMTEAALLVHIRAIHRELRGAYGWPRMWRELRRRGMRVGKERVRLVMQQAGIQARGQRRFRVTTTESKHSMPIAPNLLNRNFTVDRPNVAWTGDVTYIATEEGWLYLAVVKGRSRGHRAHAKDVDLARLVVKLCLDLVPIHLRFVAKVVGLRDEDLGLQKPHRLFALAHILAHRGLADDNLRHLLPQPHPDAMRGMPLLARRLAVRFENRVDKGERRPQLGPLPLRLLPLWRQGAGQGLAHLPTMYSQLPRYRADRPGAMLVLPPDLLV